MLEAYQLTHDAHIRAFKQIEIDVDTSYGIIWINQKPSPRPCFNPLLVEEVRCVQRILETNNGTFPWKGEMIKINFLVLDSLLDNIFSMGGDLDLFRNFIINKDKDGFLLPMKRMMMARALSVIRSVLVSDRTVIDKAQFTSPCSTQREMTVVVV